MQTELFNLPELTTSRKPLDLKVFDWEQRIRNHASKRSQSDLVANFTPESNIITYSSGVSSPADFKGYTQLDAAVGVCIKDTSGPVRSLIAEYATRGGKVFCDSGAYRNFKAREKDPTVPLIDFDEVIELYNDILDQCTNPESMIVVAPDRVGDQTASLDLLMEYRREVVLMVKQRVKIMVPLQKGALSIAELYKRCQTILGFEFVVGLPSNAEALSRQEVFDFLAEVQPAEVHFLGCSESALVHEAKHKSPGTVFSCDATKLRKHIGHGRLITEMQKQIAGEATCSAIHGSDHQRVSDIGHWDETEILGDLAGYVESLSKPGLNEFAKAVTMKPAKVRTALLEGQLWDAIDEACYGYGEQTVQQYIWSACQKQLGPLTRTQVIKELVGHDII